MTISDDNLKLEKVFFDLRFKPNLLFYDGMYKIGTELNQFFPNWQTDRLTIRLTDEKTYSAVLIGHNKIISEIDEPENFHIFKSLIFKGKKAYTNNIPINEAIRVGMRFMWLVHVDFNFKELNEIIQQKYCKYLENIEKFFVSKFKDVGFSFDFEKNDYNFHLEFGPVQKEELSRRIKPTELISGDNKFFKFPDIGLFFDIDCFTVDLKIGQLEEFLDKAYDLSKGIIEGLTKFALEV